MTVACEFRYLNRSPLLPHFGLFRRRLDRGAVGVGLAVEAAGELLVGFALLFVFSLAFGERGGAFTFSDSWAPKSRGMGGLASRTEVASA